ncbi:FadR/GntR family transcriptional regulator [Enterovirga aerilata]|uniref:FadR family transcriptional regulator n=1 Tax=Enterovirga aerilata TaxID=2730920 RepID=A0A849HW77_9HYPH|nr:FadR/GntR family transcriptional regulator [Enterovirga sp. DB1703]NNM71352.1 FadR family transcriptional regulator [Enterovirga sp. DB1703]
MHDRIEITRAEDAGAKGFEKVFAFLRARLLAGDLKPGDRLLPERELAVILGVSRPIVREALRALTVLGLVEIKDRVGTVVRRPDVSVLNDFFAFAIAQATDVVDDVMQARIAIECQAIRLAAARATIADFERLGAALARIAPTIHDPEAGARADYDFHRSLVRASGSETLAVLYDAMAEVLMTSHVGRRRTLDAFGEIRTYLIEDHRRLFQAVVERDPERADRLLREHFAIGDEFRRKAAIGEMRPAASA